MDIVKHIAKYFVAVSAFLYLMTFGLLQRNCADIRKRLYGLIFDGWLIKPLCILPEAGYSALYPSGTEDIKILEEETADGNISAQELIVLCKLIRHCKPGRIFEIGTFDGRASLNMIANAPETARLYTLDLPRNGVDSVKLQLAPGDYQFIAKDVSGSRFCGTVYEPRIEQLLGDSAVFDFSPYYGTMDFVFVDGSHSEDYVLNDSRVALKLLHAGRGVIVWHDYGAWPGVNRALNKLYSGDPAYAGMSYVKGTSLVCLICI